MSELSQDIKNYLEKNKHINVISFDLFDTLLFRMVREPADLFCMVAEKALKKGCLKKHITPEMYKNIRKEAEKKARKKKLVSENIDEVSLKEIIDCIPSVISPQPKELLKLELETEQELCYLNPDFQKFLPFLQDWRKEGKKIIITSDMYLSCEQEQEILKACQCDPLLFDHIFVSSECLCSKTTGKLYSYVLEYYQINPENLLHIGDNYMTDIVNAQYLNINTVYYDAVSNQGVMELQLEEIKYGKLVPELFSLRKYAGACISEIPEEFQTWFRTGAMILGPFMAEMTEWILDSAEDNGIFSIYPLMREGKLFEKLLKQAASYRIGDFHIEPLYISRKAAFLPSITEYSQEFLEGFLFKRGGTISDLIDLFQLPPDSIPKNICLSEDMEQFRKNYRKKGTPEERFFHFLCSEEASRKILEKSKDCRMEMLSYLTDTLNLPENYITIDIGYKGTIQTALEKILACKDSSYRGLHLLGFGSMECIQPALENVNFMGFASMYGSCPREVSSIMQNAYLLEQFLMAPCGTTIGYENGKPVLKSSTDIPEVQNQWISYCQKGMLFYQKAYLYLKYVLKKKDFLHPDSQELAQMILRLIHCPTAEEGRVIGQISFDENYGIDMVEPLCPSSMLAEVSKGGVDTFLNNSTPGQLRWPEGLVVQVEPGYYLDKILASDSSLYEKSALRIVQEIREKDIHQVVIVGAGAAGRLLRQYCSLYGIFVEAFTDNNPKLQGNLIENIPVRTLSDIFQTNSFVIGSFAFAEELSAQVKAFKGEDAVIISA